MNRCATLSVAALLDLLGEPPNALHPVVAMGGVIGAARDALRGADKHVQFLGGAALAIGGASVCFLIGSAAERAPLPERIGVIARGWLLKTTFSWATLDCAAANVEASLATNDLDRARNGLSWLVSRDPTTLDAAGVAAAAIESVAENFGDSVVAPILAYAAFGLGGALAYRWLNTADAMIGYRGQYEWLGKAAARLDDAANLIPARLAALLLLAAAPGRAAAAWQVAWRDASATASPNAGWPMATMAGVIDRRLTKPGHYALNTPAADPTHADVARARRVVRVAWALWFTVASAVLAVGAIRRRPSGDR